jgi:transcription termination factor 2
LRKRDLKYCEIRGDVKLFVRNEIVESFNDKSNTDLRVMLLSLTAGGVGLNLVGANRMFLLDIHWNPALEQQCADRIFRVGQKKNVTIYKLLCEQTIEERIQQIQQAKIQIAEKVCRSGAESAVPGMPGNAKLNSNDLRLLFSDFPDKSN